MSPLRETSVCDHCLKTLVLFCMFVYSELCLLGSLWIWSDPGLRQLRWSYFPSHIYWGSAVGRQEDQQRTHCKSESSSELIMSLYLYFPLVSPDWPYYLQLRVYGLLLYRITCKSILCLVINSVVIFLQIGCNAVSWAPAVVPGSLIDQPSGQKPNYVKRFVSGGCDNLVKLWK